MLKEILREAQSTGKFVIYYDSDKNFDEKKLQKLKDLANRFDVYYNYSDDHRVWKKGTEMNHQIYNLMKELGVVAWKRKDGTIYPDKEEAAKASQEKSI